MTIPPTNSDQNTHAAVDLSIFARPTSKQPKPREICDQIRRLIVSGQLKPGTQLPAEVELAGAFGVSRNTLRDSLNILHQEGTIARQHGVGTFVTRQLLTPNRLDVNLGVTDIIRSTGREPSNAEIFVREIEAIEAWAQVLYTSPGTTLIEIERVRAAGGRPLVYSIDRFPAHLLNACPPPITAADVERYLHQESSLYRLFEERLSLTMDYGVATLKPALADAHLAHKLKVPEGTQLMFLGQTDYNARGQPLIYSHEYHIADEYSFTVFRKR